MSKTFCRYERITDPMAAKTKPVAKNVKTAKGKASTAATITPPAKLDMRTKAGKAAAAKSASKPARAPRAR